MQPPHRSIPEKVDLVQPNMRRLEPSLPPRRPAAATCRQKKRTNKSSQGEFIHDDEVKTSLFFMPVAMVTKYFDLKSIGKSGLRYVLMLFNVRQMFAGDNCWELKIEEYRNPASMWSKKRNDHAYGLA